MSARLPGKSRQAAPVRSQPPNTQKLMQRLEMLEQETQVHLANTGHSRWMIPYADLVTLLLGLFMLLFSMSTMENQELASTAESLQRTLQENQLLADAGGGGDVNFTGYAADISPETELQKTLNEQLDDASGVQVSVEARGVVISLPDTLLFSPGSAELSASARQTLNTLATTLRPLNRPIRVEGHTDDSPIATSKYPSNWELSTARATNILKYLHTSHGMLPQLMSAAGYGEFRPVADNSSVKGKQRNRRVDIVVLSAESAESEPQDAPSLKSLKTLGEWPVSEEKTT